MKLTNYHSTGVALLVTLLFSACADDHSADNQLLTASEGGSFQQFTLLPARETGIDFNNDLVEDISRQMDVLSYQYYFNGGGVAIIDVNNDGLSDLFMTANTGSNRLYLNKGDMKFEDITQNAGLADNLWSTGATVADINNDGWQDLYVCNGGVYTDPNKRKNKLYINKGNNTFVEEGEIYGVADGNRSTQASFFDYDKDGDLDLFVMNHAAYFRVALRAVFQDLENPGKLAQASSTLYQNNGNGTFANVTKKAGMLRYGYGLGLVVSDIDSDGWPDVYVANDFSVPDFFYINNGDGTFTDKQKTLTNQVSWFGMGCDVADFNNDGLLDIGVVDMAANDHIRGKTLMANMDSKGFWQLVNKLDYQYQYMFNAFQVNHGNGHFSNIANLAGTAKTDWSWAALFADFDNDGQKDYYVTNGYRRYALDNDFRNMMSEVRAQYANTMVPIEKRQELYDKIPTVRLPNQLFHNGGQLEFSEKAGEWGLAQPSFSNGAAYGDLDNDGDLDLVVNNIHETAFVYRNNAEKLGKNNYLRVKLEKEAPADQVLNTRVTIYNKEGQQFQEYTRSRGFQGAMEGVVHFGLGEATAVEKLIVEWPDGTTRLLENVDVNQQLTVNKSAGVVYQMEESNAEPLFVEIPVAKTGLDFQHRENEFDDFVEEILLPHRQSRLGPFLGTGDANGDGLDDVYVGGAMNQSGMLYLQNNNGSFNSAPSQPFAKERGSEDMGSHFFDADGDGMLDLYVVSGGGNEFDAGDGKLQDRLYVNTGAGKYVLSNALPAMKESGSRVKSADYDNDGDLDLFVGGRLIPGKYPQAPRSYLLQNNNGQFKDVTADMAPALVDPGLVTDFEWTDFNGDGNIDLVVVGEWMPVKFLKNMGGSFADVTAEMGLEKNTGWWYSIASADVDTDGDMDFVVGNIGTNTKFSASEKKPLSVYYGDFDNNGTGDIVLAKEYQGKPVPVRGRQCSSEQMPFIQAKFPTFQKYAEASLPDIYGEEQLQAALHLDARTFYTSVMINNGDAGFEIIPLPNQAQFSATNCIALKDFNDDGNVDILLAGNMYHTEVETPRYDAGVGCFLEGDGNGGFAAKSVAESGFYAAGDVKDLQLIGLGTSGRNGLIVSNNGGGVQLFEVKDAPMK